MPRPNITLLPVNEAVLEDPARQADLLNRFQNAVIEAFQYLFGLPLSLGQVLVRDVSLTTTATAVRHGLGRKIQGYIVVRRSAVATVTDADTLTPNDTVSLTASAPVTASLLFF